MKTSLFILLFLTSFSISLADTPFSDPATEERTIHLFKAIRCQICQGESIDDSKADLAKDMRLLIRKQIEQGATDQEIKTFLTQRYGQNILMETPFSPATWLLWLAPLGLLIFGTIMILKTRR